MRSFRLSALASTIGTYILIFVGGLVRVSGAGLGCPDWPTCFGSWIPPTSVDQLPPYIDPSQFNLTLAWIEYLNRWCGVVVGVLIAITGLLALKNVRHIPRLLYPSVAAAILVAIQGWQGRAVILTELEPVVVSVHMVLALVIVSLLVWVMLQAYYLDDRTRFRTDRLPPKTATWMGILWALTIVQVVLGTQMRQKLEVLAGEFPLAHSLEWITKTGALGHIHMTVGLVVAILTWWFGSKVFSKTTPEATFVRQYTLAAMFLAALQIVLGLGFMIFGVPPIIQVFHMWIASLFVGVVLVLFALGRLSRQAAANGGSG